MLRVGNVVELIGHIISMLASDTGDSLSSVDWPASLERALVTSASLSALQSACANPPCALMRTLAHRADDERAAAALLYGAPSDTWP